MRETRSSGSVQGAMSNHGSYCDSYSTPDYFFDQNVIVLCDIQ
jgi:hypothetical protein